MPSEATAYQGTLYRLRFEAWLAAQDLTLEQNRILKIIAEQIKANAASIQRWDIARFIRPPFSSQGGLAQARQAFGGDEPLQQIIESLNRALFTDAA